MSGTINVNQQILKNARHQKCNITGNHDYAFLAQPGWACLSDKYLMTLKSVCEMWGMRAARGKRTETPVYGT